VSKHSNWFLALSVGVLAMAASAPLAEGATVFTCPEGTVATANFASANLGATATTCGSVAAGANSVTASIPTGSAGSFVEAWLGVLLSLPNGFQGQSASVLRFDNFQAVLGSTISFQWGATFEPGTEGYVFALLDGTKTVLQEVTKVPIALVAVPTTQLTIGSDGAHSLALGIVQGCSAGNCLVINPSPDPSATFSAVTLADPLSTPEPVTTALMGIGLVAIAAGLIRRKKRS
jgi:hypothetical protein